MPSPESSEQMAELFDGVTSDPVPVEPSLSEVGLSVGDRTIAYGQVLSVERIASRYRIQFADGTVLVVTDVAFVRELELRLQAGRSGLRLWLHRWSSLPLWKQVLLGALVGGTFAGLVYAAFLQVYRLVPDRYDRHIGNKLDAQVMELFDTCAAPELVAFGRKAVDALSLPEDRFRHRIVVINDPTVNAVALPGGNIYLFRGILEASETPDEILGVVAHEIAHVERRHGVQQLGRTAAVAFLSSLVIGADVDGVEMTDKLEALGEIGSTLLVLRYSRGFEREADLEGLHRLRSASISALGLGRLLVRIEGRHAVDSGLSWLSTHPRAIERLRRYEQELASSPAPPRPNPRFDTERAEWSSIKRSCPEARAWKERLKLPW
jgi:beta-barrel assembly-enhancing protease